jgi:phosphoribosylformylglycinamidine synthase II
MALHRIEVRVKSGQVDPKARAVARELVAAGLAASLPLGGGSEGSGIEPRFAKVYLIEGDLSLDQAHIAAGRLLADPVVEDATVGPAPTPDKHVTIEVHPLAGVMDPAAESVAEGLRTLLDIQGVRVSTGQRYDCPVFRPGDEQRLTDFARRALANPVIHQISNGPWLPAALPSGHEYKLTLRSVPLRELTSAQLIVLSREAHLFLSLDEMQEIQRYYITLGREPTDIELETLAQTWSEHCVHKTLKSKVKYRPAGGDARNGGHASKQSNDGPRSARSARDPLSADFSFSSSLGGRGRIEQDSDDDADVEGMEGWENDGSEAAKRGDGDPIEWSGRPGHTVLPDGSVEIDNLLKSTVAAATFELIAEGIDWTLSVFKDNSGVIALDDQWGVCIKVETHNHPSALEPYGGSATGIGGCIRDIIGTGLGAKPIASTDVFCVANPEHWSLTSGRSGRYVLPPGTLEPRRILTQVVAGVRDYGNRMGIPTINGAVYFNDRYVGNPLVFCGCVGLIPRTHVKGGAKRGDHIIAVGGATGRDGVHGATFSSAELEQGHADEFSHAVQIGNAIEEKRTLDVILRARDAGLFTGITDCGAGGFSSAVGEMGASTGASVHLDRAPLKYAGLSYTEIWISEAQERLVMSVPEKNLAALREICAAEGVQMADLGVFGCGPEEDPRLELYYHGQRVGELSMHVLHDGIPQKQREATWSPMNPAQIVAACEDLPRASTRTALLTLLAHPNIASKRWIVRQYDHEVQGATVVKPLVGPGGRGPSDGSVIEPIAGSDRGIALACGLSVWNEPLAKETGGAYAGDAYLTTLAGIDECVRNLVCIGADPTRIAILDNFCWPSCDKPENMGSLVRAAEACYDGAKAYRTPFVSGKDSLNNQLRYNDPATGVQKVIEIPPTLLVTGMGIVTSVKRSITMDAKAAGNTLLMIGATTAQMGGSHFAQAFASEDVTFPKVNLTSGPAAARAVAACIQQGLVRSAHDCSDGGMLVAVAEMLVATTGPARASKADVSITPGLSALASIGVSNSSAANVSNAAESVVDRLVRQVVGGASASTSVARSGIPALGAELTIDPNLLEANELAFAETPSRYILEVATADVPKVRALMRDFGGLPCAVLGTLNTSGVLAWDKGDVNISVDELASAWLGTLDW